ncbi:uncharacterized protein [Trachinotus anak]|uniref:uncharacterized protein isoform X3 n=1 Tax=Trachinotus anak TaxID=443729 RepID=UPI0039F214A0
MEYNEESLTHLQCPAGSVVGRRNVEVKREKSSNERVGWTLGVKTSRPKISIKLFSGVCNDNEPCMAHHRYSDDEHEGDSDNNCGRDTVYAKVEASQKDIQHRKDKGTAAAQTQIPSTKPKARTLVASRQLIDGNEVASLRDQFRPPLTLRGTASLAASDPRRTSSVHTSVTHNKTMQHSIWGMPGSGAPNYHLGTAKRTKSLCTAGILPQEQIRDKGFSGIPFSSL